MPHKRQKRSVRDAATKAAGYDNPPLARDALTLPAPASSQPIGVLAPELQGEKNNKRRKKKASDVAKNNRDQFGGRNDLGGMSKNMHRILNAGAVREEYHKNKRRKLEEAESKLNPNQKKVALTPLPYESLSTFNRRVETTLRPTIDTAIRASKASALKKKDRKGKKAARGEDGGGGGGGAGGDDDADDADYDESKTTTKAGKVKAKPTPRESIDPYVPPPRQPGGPARPTEFEEASQRRSVGDVVQAPPTLSLPRRGKKAVGVNEPLPASRMPVSPALKEMMEKERLRAVAAYRQLKEQREQDKKRDD